MPLLDVPGARLWYTDTGGAQPTVLFVHPAAGSSDSWVNQIDVFVAAGFRCITYDLRGWGRSIQAADAADAGYLSDDLEALVTGLGLQRFSLVAAAYGGFGGLDYALRFAEERLNALVLSTTQGGLADPDYRAVLERSVPPAIRALPVQLRELGPSYRAEDPSGVSRWLEIANAAGHAAPRQSLRLSITLPMLESLRIPTLFVAAGADLLAPPALMRLMAARVPGSKLAVLAEAGHSAHWERPDEWNRTVLDFLATTDP